MSHSVSRRDFARLLLSGAILATFNPTPAESLATPFTPAEDLKSRIAQRAPARPEAKLFEQDIYYPDYFAGVWRTESKLVSVTCPAGYKLFGRPGSFEAAQRDVNHVLEYQSRFVRAGKHVVSDRAFNVRAIAEASMGPKSVLDCSQPGNGPNRLLTTVRPNGAEGGIFLVRINVLARQQQEGTLPRATKEGAEFNAAPAFLTKSEEADSTRVAAADPVGLYTSEMVRQEVRLDTEDIRVSPLIKEVETTTLFVTKPQNEDYIEAWQKTSTYLTRSSLQYVDARGRPVDVRWYQLRYIRKSTPSAS